MWWLSEEAGFSFEVASLNKFIIAIMAVSYACFQLYEFAPYEI